MSLIRGVDTKPEIIFRKLLFAKGYRYRTHVKGIKGRPDLVLRKHNALIFINGCFWHGHENCRYYRLPQSNVDFWRNKIDGNIERDVRKFSELEKEGWRILVVWECGLKGKANIPATVDLAEKWLLSSKTGISEVCANGIHRTPSLKSTKI